MTIAVSMPVCILAVFVLMYVCDLTLNMMSLGGIAMGVGMIVDNSIIVLENIYRWASEGHDRMTSCVEGTKEVTLADRLDPHHRRGVPAARPHRRHRGSDL